MDETSEIPKVPDSDEPSAAQLIWLSLFALSLIFLVVVFAWFVVLPSIASTFKEITGQYGWVGVGVVIALFIVILGLIPIVLDAVYGSHE